MVVVCDVGEIEEERGRYSSVAKAQPHRAALPDHWVLDGEGHVLVGESNFFDWVKTSSGYLLNGNFADAVEDVSGRN